MRPHATHVTPGSVLLELLGDSRHCLAHIVQDVNVAQLGDLLLQHAVGLHYSVDATLSEF